MDDTVLLFNDTSLDKLYGKANEGLSLVKKLSISDLRSNHNVMYNLCNKYDKLLEEKEKLDTNNRNQLDECENKTKFSNINSAIHKGNLILDINNTLQLSPNISQRTKLRMTEVEILQTDISERLDCDSELSAPEIRHCRKNKQIDHCHTNTVVSSKKDKPSNFKQLDDQTNKSIRDDKIPKTPKRKK
ncbi:Hypothetical protein CINCED_3A015992 [Cinara cedri]|uniref:Uncharacterized protein n=1 Tax=Cinara cedri TaxID=506608 RepID=A0A5E4N336_9HEMI|nr:Hypothetical protein CINCED_3A015992 [Cinara cedri]